MVASCEIEFESNSSDIFYSGQCLSGAVVLKLDKTKEVKGVVLRIGGYVLTRFGPRQQYYGREDYIALQRYLLSSTEPNRHIIPAGTHKFDFCCELPSYLPSSFDSQYGCVRYAVQVTFLRPWNWDEVYARDFILLSRLDLNFEPIMSRSPAGVGSCKSLYCGRRGSNVSKMDLYLPHICYAPGQLISVHVLIANNTHKTLETVKCSLVMSVQCYSQVPSRRVHTERRTLTQVQSDSVLRYCTRSLSLELLVPTTPPSSRSLGALIQITYYVQVKAKTGKWHMDHVLTMPVTIGNVPLSASLANAIHADGAIESSLPPPSYEEALHVVRSDYKVVALQNCEPANYPSRCAINNLNLAANATHS